MSEQATFTAIVDRIEDDQVVLEMQFGHQVIIPEIYCPRGIGDGSVLKITITYDKNETLKRRDEIMELFK